MEPENQNINPPDPTEEPRKGRRRGDNPKTLRAIDETHRLNWLYFMGELARQRKAIEAIASRDALLTQQALDDLRQGDKNA